MTQARYDAIIFDMDGTLTVPVIDFYALRDELGMEGEVDFLPEIASWSPERQKAAWELIEQYEVESRERLALQDGAGEALRRFAEAGIGLGILTRNTREATDLVLPLLEGISFDLVMTREDEFIKPDPKAIEVMLEHWQVDPQRALMVGDYLHDIVCANGAGAESCFFQNDGAKSFSENADHVVHSFAELEALVFDA